MNRSAILISAAALLALPSLALAQTSTSTVTINGNVTPACTLGSPTNATLDLGTLTDASGRLTPALASAAIAQQTTIANAWCNTPSNLTMTSSPLTLQTAPAYATPTGFSRALTYNVTLTNWFGGNLVARPVTAGTTTPRAATSAHAANPLGVQFASLAPLSGTTEAPTNYIEAGAYSATVQITLAVQP